MQLQPFVRRVGAFALAVSLTAGLAVARDYAAGALKISHPWSPAAPVGAPTAAGYLTITNAGATPDTLVSASTPDAKSVEIHQETMQGGIMRMRPVTGGLTVPAHGALTLAPSGYHLMLIAPRRAFRPGESIPLDLRFSRHGIVHVALSVEAPRPSGMAGMHM